VSPRSPSSTTRRTLLGGCTVLVAGLAGCSQLTSSDPFPSPKNAGEGWPHRFRDLGNTNAAPEGPESLTEQWSRRVEARLDRPIVRDGTVITVATTRKRRRSFRTRVLGIDAETGDQQWTFDLQHVRRARIAAAVDDRVYIVGEELEDTRDERLYAVDMDDSIAWRFEAEHLTAVAATASTVFASVRHGSVVVLDASDGAPAARLHPAGWTVGRWLSDRTPIGRPTVLDGRVFAPFARYDTDREDSYYGDEIVAFDADGIVWKAPLDDVCFVDHVAAVDGTVYVLTMDQCPGDTEAISSSLAALDATSGERRWTRSIEGGLVSPVTVSGDAITVAGGDVHTFDPDGDRRWREQVFSGPPVIAGNRVYGRRTEDGAIDTVVAVDLETGESLDAHTFEHQLNRAPVFADGRAVVRTLEYDRTEDGAEHVADRIHMLR
jgi:outer membrane protein assembly factor BamB